MRSAQLWYIHNIIIYNIIYCTYLTCSNSYKETSAYKSFVFQGMSIYMATFTLTAIALDRSVILVLPYMLQFSNWSCDKDLFDDAVQVLTCALRLGYRLPQIQLIRSRNDRAERFGAQYLVINLITYFFFYEKLQFITLASTVLRLIFISLLN